MYSSEYELGNVGEDFGLQPIGEDDEAFDDDETFGDIGPLNILPCVRLYYKSVTILT